MTVAPYKDGTRSNDHSYYGNGCSSSSGGSITPCSTRIVQTADNENQENGVYYNFQAITNGTGASISATDTNSSDTICPLGWQLPHAGTGGDYYNKSRSWNYLFTTYGVAFDAGTTADATKIKSYPFSYVYSGYYNWTSGKLSDLNEHGYYWSSTVASNTNAYDLGTWSSVIFSTLSDNKTYGFNVRCDFDISNIESSPWHPRSLISIMAFHFLKAHFPSVKIMSNRMPAKNLNLCQKRMRNRCC